VNQRLKAAYDQTARRVTGLGDVDRAIANARRRRIRRATAAPIAAAVLAAAVTVVAVAAPWSDSDTASPSEPQFLQPSEPQVSFIEPGSFGSRYWRLFEAELHDEFGFVTQETTNGALPSGALWFRMRGQTSAIDDDVTVRIFAKRHASLVAGEDLPSFRDKPYVRVHPLPTGTIPGQDDPHGMLIIARDDRGNMLRVELTGLRTESLRQEFRDVVKFVIRA
jgi:hypothetical protein